MAASQAEKNGSNKSVRKDRIIEVANAFEWLITAFILAFVFRAFIMEAFRIPTGSMADTLKGDHFRLRCSQCGYKYDYGFDTRGSHIPDGATPSGNVQLPVSRCPSCGYYDRSGRAIPVSNGDRILVLKCIYQFIGPKRWDVVVFKNPLDPKINYIKRLIALPRESIEIIDGDIYIDGQITRKPPKVQDELWMPVYDNDYQPVRPDQFSFNQQTWRQPFTNLGDSKWQIGKNNPTAFVLDSTPENINYLTYDTSVGNDFRTTYAYDSISDYKQMPFCSDLLVRFYATSAQPQGRIGAGLSKYGNYYRAGVDETGFMAIEAVSGKETMQLISKSVQPPPADKAIEVEFSNVDHLLTFKFGSDVLSYDLGRFPDDAGERDTEIQPNVTVFASGKLTLSHLAIFRDVHYTSRKFANSPPMARGKEGEPFTLDSDEFFVLGDNSPNSEDGRWWDKQGTANPGIPPYREGIVPRDYLVGKALFVYWPSGSRPFPRSRLALIPNFGQMRFIYGGSNRLP
jgi:signal peptidase I